MYPDIFTPECGVRSDAITMKRQRCELPNLPVNTSFSVPSHIDALYKEVINYVKNVFFFNFNTFAYQNIHLFIVKCDLN